MFQYVVASKLLLFVCLTCSFQDEAIHTAVVGDVTSREIDMKAICINILKVERESKIRMTLSS